MVVPFEIWEREVRRFRRAGQLLGGGGPTDVGDSFVHVYYQGPVDQIGETGEIHRARRNEARPGRHGYADITPTQSLRF